MLCLGDLGNVLGDEVHCVSHAVIKFGAVLLLGISINPLYGEGRVE